MPVLKFSFVSPSLLTPTLARQVILEGFPFINGLCSGFFGFIFAAVMLFNIPLFIFSQSWL